MGFDKTIGEVSICPSQARVRYYSHPGIQVNFGA